MRLFKSFKNLSEYKSKFKIPVILAIMVGFIFAILKSMTFILSSKKLLLEMSSILNNYLLVLLVAVSVMIPIFATLPAIKDLNEYITRFKIAVILAIVVGLMFGILESIDFVISEPNRYLQLKMYYLILNLASPIIHHYLLITVGIVIFVFVMLIAIEAFLNFIGLSRKASEIIVSGIVPSFLIFTVGGYWINKVYLPGFFELKSIIGNVIWALTCVLLGRALGWLTLKISQMKLNFSPKIYSIKSLVGVLLGLVILFNVFPHFYTLSLKLLKPDRPNLIVISIDTLRADHLSCYGYNRNTTPNIDRFARDGVRFANTIVQAPWTLPSHMSLLTGLYPSSHGVVEPSNKLKDEHLTLAEILQNAGYETTAFTNSGYLSLRFGYQGFDDFDESYGYKGLSEVETIYSMAVNWLKKSHSRPFFLFLHTYQVHAPYDPPPTYDIYSDKNYQGIVEVSGNNSNYYGGIKPKMTIEDYQYVIDKYDGEIYYTDHFLGKLFKKLRDLGLYDKSIIVLTSDHGENFLDHSVYNIDHKELYDEIVKVPLIIKASTFPKNQVIDIQVESIDIMPTVLERLGISIPNMIDGESLVELLKKRSYDNVFAFSESVLPSRREYKMIRTNNWKLLLRFQNELELFDLKSDPKEQHNLFAEKTEIAESLHEKLSTWVNKQEEKSKVFSTDKVQLDDELKKKLKALGYIN